VVTCTFTNVKRGRIVVVKDAQPNAPQNFSFTTGGGLSPSSFQLDDDSDGTLPNTETFNNVAVGAAHGLAACGAKRVLVLDWDVHHGNGTEAIFAASPDVLYASIHQSPLYPGTGAAEYAGEGVGDGYTVNLPVPPGAGSEEFLALVEHVVVPIGREYAPDLIALSAGYDAHRDDPLASLALETSSYGHMSSLVRALGEELGAPVGALLEGGYDLRALAESVPETMAALAGDADPPAAARHPLADQAAEVLGRYWEL